MPASRLQEQPCIFHPFIVALIPLCLRAVEVEYSALSFRYSVYYAIFVCILHVLSPLSDRIAYGPPREVDQQDEVVVITGGANGLGRCLTETYAMKGASIAVLDIQDIEDEEEILEDVKYYKCDIGDRASVCKTWADITKDLGIPTVLINNAAIVHGKRFLNLTPEDIEKTFRTNVIAQYHLNLLFISGLTSNIHGGTLVTISSILGKLGASQLTDYSASKAALLAFHTSLTSELSSTHPHIKTILVTSGQLSTELFSGVKQGAVQRFFGPLVEIQDLAMRIIRMIEDGQGGVISMPLYARWIGILDLLPVGLQKTLRGLTGLDTAMKGFQPTVEKKESLVR